MKQIYREIIWGGETWESGAQNRIVFLSIFVLVFFGIVAAMPWNTEFKIMLGNFGTPFVISAVFITFIWIFIGKSIDTPEAPND